MASGHIDKKNHSVKIQNPEKKMVGVIYNAFFCVTNDLKFINNSLIKI
jgi:hypothetical protein